MMPTNQILCNKTIPEPRNSKQSKFFKNLKNSNNLGIRSESSQIIKVNRMLVTCYPVKHDVLWLKMFIRICFNKWKMLTWLILRLSPYVYPFSLGFPTWLKYLHLKRRLKDTARHRDFTLSANGIFKSRFSLECVGKSENLNFGISV